MKKIVYLFVGLTLIVLTVFQVRALRADRPLSSAPKPAERARIVAEGRVVAYPGAEVTVGTDVAGTLQSLRVEEKDVVKRGDVLAVIKAEELRAGLREAEAVVAEAQADIRLYEAERERAKRMWEEQVGTRQNRDRADRDVDSARARKDRARAEVERLRALLEKTTIFAPIDGTVISRETHAGETVDAGADLLTIANLDRIRVEAEVDEYDASRVSLGAPVKLRAEGYDRTWTGVIEEIPDAMISRRLKPQDPSKPVDTRVLLVKVSLSAQTPLKLGQRVEVEIGEAPLRSF